jgi:hypothetical protein
MTWKEFKDSVRTFLLVDAQRKGRGVQNYINQLMRSAIIDLQRFIPELLVSTIESYRSPESVTDWDATKQYAFGDIVTRRNLTVNTKYGAPVYQAVKGTLDESVTQPTLGEDPSTSPNWTLIDAISKTADGAYEGSFNKQFSRVKNVYIRKFPLSPTNTLTKSKYYSVRQVNWDDRYMLLDGKTPHKSISFGDDGFIYAPELGLDEKLLIEWRGENHFSGASYFDTTTHDAEEVVFDDREAKAVSEYVKAHLQREVDKDLNMYQSHWTQYQKERQEIYRERREHKPSDLTDPYPVAGATVGPQQIN